MKSLLFFCGLFISFLVFAQYSPQEIKKYKISKVIKISVNGDASETQKQEKLYDSYGNDTATYLDGQLYMRSVYEYNEKGQPAKRITYNFSGNENETALYEYNPDGTFIISNTDKQFEMTDFTYYDKQGRITKTVSPDKAEKIYSYNLKGQLIGIKSKPGNGGVLVNIQYTYNPKGQLIKEASIGEYKWTLTYTYNAKGLIAKTKNISIMDGVAEPGSVSSYEYEFR
jgi:YD repeat-containing protein